MQQLTYPQALAHFKRHSNNTFLIKLFTSNQNTFTKQKLFAEVAKLAIPVAANTATTISKSYKTKTGIDKEKLTKPLKDVYYNKYIPAQRERSYLHSRLETLIEAERNIAAHEILELDDEITAMHHRMVHYCETGVDNAQPIPPPAVNKIELMEQLCHKRNNIRTNISRHKKKPELLAKHKKALAQVEQEITTLKLEG